MRIFVTGATGFIGSALVPNLIQAGHQVLGLCRAPEKAQALAAQGAEVLHGSMTDHALMRSAAAGSDGVIHLAFNHDFSTFVANCADDAEVVTALADGLAGTGKPLVVTSGVAIGRAAPGAVLTEEAPTQDAGVIPRAASEQALWAAAERGVKAIAVRLPQVHDRRRQGLITPYIAIARAKGFLAYVGDGATRWAAAHVSDVAPLYRLAIERAAPRAVYNAVGEEGVSIRAIAETLSARLGLPVKALTPEEAPAYFGWMALFAQHDMPASSARTQADLGWTPQGRGLLADLAELDLSEG